MSKFKFRRKAPSQEKMKERAEARGMGYDSIFKGHAQIFRCKEGDNTIRILPATWDEPEHHAYDIWIHRNVGADNQTYLCLDKMRKKPCPICKAVRQMQERGETEEAKKLAVRRDVIVYVINRDGDAKTPNVYQMSWRADRDILQLAKSKRTGKFLEIDRENDGYDLTINRQGTGLKTRYLYNIERDPSPIHEKASVQDSILQYITENPLPDLLNFYDGDYIEQVLFGAADKGGRDEDDEDDEDDDNRKGKYRDEEDDEDEEDDGDDEDSDTETRSRSSSKGRRRDDEDEDDEEDDDTETRSRSSSKNRRRDEEDDDVSAETRSRSSKKRRDRDEEDDDEDDDEESDGKNRRRISRNRSLYR